MELYRNCPLKETVRLRMPFDWTLRMYIASPTIGLSLPQARRTREINSPRRFRPLMRNATPAGATRPPFVQLFASSTGRPIYCQSEYTAWRRYLLAGKRATVRVRIDISAIAISDVRHPRQAWPWRMHKSTARCNASSHYPEIAVLLCSVVFSLTLTLCVPVNVW